jgi:glycyl-tRNA synthetase beta chain
VIDAVLSSRWGDLVDAMDRVVSLTRLNGASLKAAKVIERTRNILKGATVKQTQVDPAQFQDPLEHQLWQAYQAQQERLQQLMAQRAYGEATMLYGDTFYEPLHAFFDRVMVNVKEEAIQQNRLALMHTINTLYTDRVADLSKLTILTRS